MSDPAIGNDGSLMPARRRELMSVTCPNSLVTRGLTDLIKDHFARKIIPLNDDALFHYNRAKARSAMEAYQMAIKDFDEAIRLLSQAIRLDPNNGLAHLQRGDAWLGRSNAVDHVADESQDYDKEIKKLDKAIQLDPLSVLCYNRRGIAWYFKNDYDRAIKDFDEAIRLDPKDPLAFANRFWPRCGKKDKMAEEDLDQSRRLGIRSIPFDDRRQISWILMSNHEKAIMDFDAAIRLFGDAIKADPNNALTYLQRGKAWFGKYVWTDCDDDDDPFNNAIRDLDKAISIDSDNALAFRYRGKAWRMLRRVDKQFKDYDKAILLDPENAAFYYHRGMAWLRKSDYEKAIKDFDGAIQRDSQNALYYNRRGIAWYFKKDYGKAISDFGDAIRLDPHNTYAYRRRSFIWLGNKDFDKAVNNCDEAILHCPNDAFFYYHRGEARLGKHECAKAIENYDEAIRLSPTGYAGFAFSGRGTAWLGKKRYDKAIKDFEEAIRLDSRLELDRGAARMREKREGTPSSNPSEWDMICSLDRFRYITANNDFHEAIWLDPKSRFAYGKLAWLLATCPEATARDGKRAVTIGTTACELTDWKSGRELDVLAAGYAETSQFDEAERYQRKALEDPAYQGLAGDEFRERLELYKRKRPFRHIT